jgi:K+-sensing histidine kinase KdpD
MEKHLAGNAISGASHQAAQIVRTIGGVLLTVASAGAVTRISSHTQFKGVVPLIFAVVPVLVAASCGLLSGLVGAVLSALIFAHFLFGPTQNLGAYASFAHKSLGWMLLASFTLSYLLFPPGAEKHHH